MWQVLLLDELTTFLDGEDQRGVLEAVRSCVGGPDQVRHVQQPREKRFP